MAALSALMGIGLFDIKGGCDPEPMYQITTPLFDTVTIHLHPDYYPGKTFTITTANNAPEHRYIQSARLNGRSLQQCWFPHADFKNGGTLALNLGPEPNQAWGVKILPPSETTGTPSFAVSGLDYPREVDAGEPIRVTYNVK